ncbi:MAG: hypothetical protein M1820_006925 [Bogoriella megaspora]|nr:MAG: hypothetical protein M1820_006925 [Bogoriella megaspora]
MNVPAILARAGLQHGKFEDRIDYNFIPSSSSAADKASQWLLVFVNGLMLPQVGWFPAIANLLEKCKTENINYTPMLSYDRSGQGQSGLHPKDANPEPDSEPGHRHDVVDAAEELNELVGDISIKAGLQNPKLILVANSIGGPLSRLYMQRYPGTVAGLIILDSNPANTDFVSIWPDPDAPGFDVNSLPGGIDPEGLRDARAKTRKFFHPANPNAEGLSRRNLPELLPDSDKPKLEGPGDKGPLLTIVGHDPEAFAEESFTGSLQLPKLYTLQYVQPFWHEYNLGLSKLTDPDRSVGPILANGCGHFIQKDDPPFVANLIIDILSRLQHKK